MKKSMLYIKNNMLYCLFKIHLILRLALSNAYSYILFVKLNA